MKSRSERIRLLIEVFTIIICLGVILYRHNIHYNSASSLYYEGKSLEARGRYDEASEVFKRSIRLDPNVGKAHLMLGVVYTRKCEFKEAEKEYKKALRLNMSKINKVITHYNLGVIYLEYMGLCDKAITEYEAAIKIYPNLIDSSTDSYHGLARAYLAKLKYEKAVQEAKKSIEFNPESEKGYHLLGEAYLLKKDIESARKVYEKLKDIDKGLAKKLYANIKNAEDERFQIEELAASGCFEDNINAACFYTKACSMVVGPLSDFYGDFFKKAGDVINNGWVENKKGLKEFLKRNQGAIEEFKKGALLETCDFTFGKEYKYSVTRRLPNMLKLRNLTYALLLNSRYHEEHGELDKAIELCFLTLTFARHISQDNSLVLKVLALTTEKQAYAPLRDYLASKKIDREDCQAILSYLEDYEKQHFAPEELVEVEKEFFISSVQMIVDEPRAPVQKTALDITGGKEALRNEILTQAPGLVDRYYGNLIKAVRTNEESDWEFAENELEALREEADPGAAKNIKDISSLLYDGFTKKTGMVNKKIARKIIVVMLAVAMPNIKRAAERYYSTLKQLKELKSLAAQKVQPQTPDGFVDS